MIHKHFNAPITVRMYSCQLKYFRIYIYSTVRPPFPFPIQYQCKKYSGSPKACPTDPIRGGSYSGIIRLRSLGHYLTSILVSNLIEIIDDFAKGLMIARVLFSLVQNLKGQEEREAKRHRQASVCYKDCLYKCYG